MEPEALRDLAVRIARAAGELLRQRPAALTVATKSSPTDVVTVMDRRSEALITGELLAARPHDAILGEEGTSRSGTSGVRWIVDPLDGTVNYLYGLAPYAVSIAAEIAGQVVAGAVYDASTGSVYEAVRGGGARIDGLPLACSRADSLALTLVATGFGYRAQRRAQQGAVVAALLPKVRDIRRFGSAALDLCAVAAGRVDAYYERGIRPWDGAAGVLIAAEAGARVTVVTDSDGGLTVAAAPGVFTALTTELAAAYAAARDTTTNSEN